jgi:hypothetical protein
LPAKKWPSRWTAPTRRVNMVDCVMCGTVVCGG